MRILFAGSPALAVPSLERIAREGDICAVLTGVDRPAGRGRRAAQTPVKEAALRLGLTVIEADRVDDPVEARVRELAPDLLVVAAFGRIFRKSFLDLFPSGGINVHPSLLPRHRGPSPITAAILAGDAETGVTIQRIALRFDTGDILAQCRMPLDGSETTASLTTAVGPVGAELLARVLAELEAGKAPGTPQDDRRATYCRMVRKEDGRISWSDPAANIERMVRAYDPWPRASTTYAGQTLLVLKSRALPDTLSGIAGDAGSERPPGTVTGFHPLHGLMVRAGEGVVGLERIQLQFKKPTDWRAFLNGHPEVIGTRLGG
jgi:methionyl-tRNA formyltransferase